MLQVFYKDQPLPTKPQSGRTPQKTERNLEIQFLYANGKGMSIPELGKNPSDFGYAIN